jgi:adhesin/invasin
MRAARTALAISLIALGLLACGKGTPTAPSGSKLTVTANPTQISARGTSTIQVTALRAGGLPVNPGTEIHMFTTLGTITEVVTTDANGLATATLQGTGQAGTAKVTASSGGSTSDATEVTIGQKASVITLQANPTSIPATSTSKVHLIALVRDDQGNTIPGALVVFNTEAGTLASRGTGVRTDVSGQATDTLTVTANDASTVTDGQLAVTAQVTAGGGSASVTLQIVIRS